MKKVFIILSILSLAIVKVQSQSISEIKSVTSFIYVKDTSSNWVPNGTCFFVGIESTKDKSKFYPYLITAKHVLQKKDGSYHKEIQIKMNTADSSSRFTWVPIHLTIPHKNVFVHTDASVDIAVIPYVPPKDDYLFKYLDTTFLFDRQAFKKLSIQEGTETFFTGLFRQYIGEKKIYPIVRFGRISLITEERIDWIGMKREMILLETSSFGGNSGSPVYFKIIDPNGSYTNILGGVLNGTYRDYAPIRIIKTSMDEPVAIYNNGISGITPVYLIRDILYSDELKKIRK